MVAWGMEPVPITADEALQNMSRDTDQQSERRECDQWLRETLAKGPVLATQIKSAGEDAELGYDALKRAKKRINATSKREGSGKGSKVYWLLPNASTADQSESPY